MQRRFTMKREAGTRGRCPPSRPRGPLPGMHPALMAYDIEVIARECAGESDAPPLLFVHGAGHGAWCWAEHFLDFFAEHGFDSYALSLRGHGRSGGRERLPWTSIADYVSDAEQVAAGLPRDPVLVGHSLGGRVVQKYLEAHEAPAAVLLAPPRTARPGPAHVPRASVALAAGAPQRDAAQAVRNARTRQQVLLLAGAGRGAGARVRGPHGQRVLPRLPRAGLHPAGPRAHPRRPAAGARRGWRLLHPALGDPAHRGGVRRGVEGSCRAWRTT